MSSINICFCLISGVEVKTAVAGKLGLTDYDLHRWLFPSITLVIEIVGKMFTWCDRERRRKKRSIGTRRDKRGDTSQQP